MKRSAYERDWLGYQHQIRQITRESVDEVRTHLQVFPMSNERFADRDRLTTVRNYDFSSIPGEVDEEASLEILGQTPADTRNSVAMEVL